MNSRDSVIEELKEIEKLFKEVTILIDQKILPTNNLYDEITYLNFCLVGMKMEVDMHRGSLFKSDEDVMRAKGKEIRELISKLKNKIVIFNNKV